MQGMHLASTELTNPPEDKLRTSNGDIPPGKVEGDEPVEP